MTGLERREIAERLVMLQEDIYPYELLMASEIIDAIHWAEDDLESNGGKGVLKILNEALSDYADDTDIVEPATELINTIMEGTGNDN